MLLSVNERIKVLPLVKVHKAVFTGFRLIVCFLYDRVGDLKIYSYLRRISVCVYRYFIFFTSMGILDLNSCLSSLQPLAHGLSSDACLLMCSYIDPTDTYWTGGYVPDAVLAT